MNFLGIKIPEPYRVFKKHDKPVLKPDPQVFWRSQAVFNPGGYMDKEGRIILVYRAVGEYYRYVSRFGVAVSEDGINFRYIDDKPLMIPVTEDEWWGVEDPRITVVDSELFITYVKWNCRETRLGFAKLYQEGDRFKAERTGHLDYPLNTKNAAVLKISGDKLVLIHRPWSWSPRPSIWVSPLRDVHGKQTASIVDSHPLYVTPEYAVKSGMGPPPLRLDNGDYLMLLHLVMPPEIYLVYAAIVDRELSRIKALTDKPVLVPEKDWELIGDVSFVVFPSASILVDNKIYLYYGAGDKVIKLATADLSEILSLLDKNIIEQ